MDSSWNRDFGVKTDDCTKETSDDDLHRPLNMPASRLSEILCLRDQRQLSKQLVVHYDRRQFILEDSEHARSAIGQYVETYAFADGRENGGAKFDHGSGGMMRLRAA